jgi:hypothetical protein
MKTCGNYNFKNFIFSLNNYVHFDTNKLWNTFQQIYRVLSVASGIFCMHNY